MNRNGVLAGGNWIIDCVKIIDSYPEQDSLSSILSQSISNGGSPYNILKDLSKLEADFPLEATGLVGNDENGKYILDDCKKNNILTDLLYKTSESATSYTDVMTVESTGRRTFFHQRGANSFLTENNIELEKSNAKIFHLGYILLLDKLDILDKHGMTGAANVFKKAKKLGFITSTDLVSENSNRFTSIVPPALPYIDYLFINEFEIEKLVGFSILINHVIDTNLAKKAIADVFKMGVLHAVILHFPNGAIAATRKDEYYFQPSLVLPSKKILGTVGAGDALAAGVLFGVHANWHLQQALELGVCTAASCLFHQSSSDGVLPYQKALNLKLLYPFRS